MTKSARRLMSGLATGALFAFPAMSQELTIF